MFMLFFRPPTKPCYHDVTMHAFFFQWGKVKHSDESVLPVTKKEGKERGNGPSALE